MILQFLIGAGLYTIIAFLSYSPVAKIGQWAWFVAAIGGALANVTWFWVARGVSEPARLTLIGLGWDTMLTAIYVAVPILFFGARFGWTQGAGMALITAGLMLVKL